ncbi:unnamed protein product [Lasius platythorax]|uniref:Uncharacterized protein n=1 Tax=Lasius platythorax TaxID=488582 RepID=A0AAV2NUF1_9HYME
MVRATSSVPLSIVKTLTSDSVACLSKSKYTWVFCPWMESVFLWGYHGVRPRGRLRVDPRCSSIGGESCVTSGMVTLKMCVNGPVSSSIIASLKFPCGSEECSLGVAFLCFSGTTSPVVTSWGDAVILRTRHGGQELVVVHVIESNGFFLLIEICDSN